MLSILFSSGLASAALPPLLKEVEAKYAASSTFSAQFSQGQFNKMTGQTKTSSGKILVERPSKVRWETEKPERNLLIGDGKKFWFYTPPVDPEDKDDHGQLIEKAASQVQSRLAGALISGSFSMARDMKIVQKSPSSFTLTPKPGTAGTVEIATIEVDPQKKLIQKVSLNHKGGNRAEITLSQIKLGEPLDKKLFQFVAPKNTDIIKDTD